MSERHLELVDGGPGSGERPLARQEAEAILTCVEHDARVMSLLPESSEVRRRWLAAGETAARGLTSVGLPLSREGVERLGNLGEVR